MLIKTGSNPDRARSLFFFVASVAVGFLVFAEYYPLYILNPFNVDWIFSAGDIRSHHLGLIYFLKDSWRFPLGLNPNYGMENASSLVYTDSIPIFAFVLKLFFPMRWIGEFQFMGIFLLITSWGNVFLPYLILKRFSSNRLSCLIAAWVIALIPIGAWRMMPPIGHTSLTAQFVVIGAIGVYYFLIYSSSFLRVCWLIVSFGIHPYFGFMSFFIWSGSCIDRAIIARFRLKSIAIIFVELVCLILGVYSLGYFGFSFEQSTWGYGFFSYNLLDIIDPTGYDLEGSMGVLRVSFSSIGLWPSLDKDTYWEGFNYLGLGAIFMVISSLFVSVSYAACSPTRRRMFKRFAFSRIFSFAAILFLFLLSLTHEINIGHLRFFLADKFYVDRGLIEGLAIVRSSARLAWPLIYLLVIGSISSALSYMNGSSRVARIFSALLVLSLIIQYADLANAASTLRSSYKSQGLNEFEQMLSTTIEIRKPKSLRLVDPESSSYRFLGLARVGSIHGIPTNVVYSARKRITELNSFQMCPSSSILIVPKDTGLDFDRSCNAKEIGSNNMFSAYLTE